MYMASEVGVVDVDQSKVIRKVSWNLRKVINR